MKDDAFEGMEKSAFVRSCVEFMILATVIVLGLMSAGARADDVALDVRILGPSSQGGVLLKPAPAVKLQLSDVLRVARNGDTVGEAWVTGFRPDGTVVLVPQFKGQIRSTDVLFFVRHVQTVADVGARNAGYVVNLPVDAREQALALKGTAQVLKEVGALSQDKALNARIERIGARIAAACPRSLLTWTFQVVESRQVNALTVGLGRIYVTRGLLEAVTDEELAGVLAHEVAHVCLRHSTRMTDAIDVGTLYARKATECYEEAQRIASEGGERWMVEMRVRSKLAEAQEWASKAKATESRLERWKTQDGWDEEFEADRMGLIYAMNAGFSDQGLVDCLERLAVRERREFFSASAIQGASTHPPLEMRISIARQVLHSIRASRRIDRAPVR